MSDALEFTGERFTPECVREICYEHFHRYALATRWCADKHTLDAACGEGYGSALLATTASAVEAVDICAKTVAHARQRYGQVEGLHFQVADCTSLPFADEEFECVVSFETLEHLDAQDQLLAEFRRVLKPDGLLVLSSPDKAVYSDQKNASNEFHIKELYRPELEALIGRHFSAWRLLGQKLMFHSAIWSLDGVENVSLDQLAGEILMQSSGITQPPGYFIALCAAAEAGLPDSNERLWLFDDREESVYQHYYAEIKRNMAAGAIIAGLQQELEVFKRQAGRPAPRRTSWWQRLLGKT